MKQVNGIIWAPWSPNYYRSSFWFKLKLNYDLPHDILYDKLEDEISFTQVEILNLL